MCITIGRVTKSFVKDTFQMYSEYRYVFKYSLLFVFEIFISEYCISKVFKILYKYFFLVCENVCITNV